MDKEILKGDVYYADLSPARGSEQGGVRPVVVIQNNTGNKYSPTVIVAAVTSKTLKTDIPTHLSIDVKMKGLNRESTILLEQIRTVDKRRLRNCLGNLGEDIVEEINEKLKVSLDII